jgi:recombination protein RecA
MFGNPETTPGGRALKFYASVRLDVRKVETLRNGTDVVGSHTRVKVVKNKVAPPFKEAEFDIMYGKGVSSEGCILDLAVENNIVDKSGSWFAYNGAKIAQGRDAAKQYLLDHPDIKDEIEEKIRDSYMPADDDESGVVLDGEADLPDADDSGDDDDILGIDV